MTVEQWQPIIVPIVCALIAGVVGFKGHALQKGTRENRLIDQLQEEVQRLRQETRQANARMARIEARDQVYIPHILMLNRHIEDQKGPPAPPLPTVILSYLQGDQQNSQE